MRCPARPERFSTGLPTILQFPTSIEERINARVPSLDHDPQRKEPTLDVEARAFTTPVMSSLGDVNASEIGDVSSTIPFETGFDRDRRSHHSAPIVHSLS